MSLVIENFVLLQNFDKVSYSSIGGRRTWSRRTARLEFPGNLRTSQAGILELRTILKITVNNSHATHRTQRTSSSSTCRRKENKRFWKRLSPHVPRAAWTRLLHACWCAPHTVHVHGCTLLRSYSPYDSTIVAKIGRRTQDLGSCVADFRITMIVQIRTKRLEWRKIRTWPGCARAPPFFGPRCYCSVMLTDWKCIVTEKAVLHFDRTFLLVQNQHIFMLLE